uniref:Uncharacterized protein n=1 Tax=Plectus sambesii TaxID=2011161 RepID=A0A914XA68_9BILA
MKNAKAHSIEYELHQKLLSGYDKTILPVAKTGDRIYVDVQPILYSLLKVDERIGFMEFMQWLSFSWRDANLHWNASDYENLLLTYVITSSIWTPDIAIYNQMDEIIYPFPQEETFAEVFFDGTVKVKYMTRIQIRCHNFDLSKFPYDQQTCSTRYASWMYGFDHLILTTAVVPDNSKVFKKHTEWEIVSFIPHYENASYTSLIDLTYSNGTDFVYNHTKTFTEIHYDLTIKRKPQYYIYTLVVPSLITTFICFLGLFSPFDASGNREEKVTLGLTTLLSMIIILMLVAGEMPRSGGNNPLLGNFIVFEIALCAVATATTVAIMWAHQRMELTAGQPPEILLRLTYQLLCIRETIDWKEIIQGATQQVKETITKNGAMNIAPKKEKNVLETDIALRELVKITENIKRKTQYASIKHNWIHIFRLVDFMCLIFYCSVNLIVTAVLFM